MVTLNLGLEKHPAVSYVPVYQAAICVYASLAGGTFFNEFKDFTAVDGTFYALGLLMVSGGLILLTAKPLLEGPQDPEAFPLSETIKAERKNTDLELTSTSRPGTEVHLTCDS